MVWSFLGRQGGGILVVVDDTKEEEFLAHHARPKSAQGYSLDGLATFGNRN